MVKKQPNDYKSFIKKLNKLNGKIEKKEIKKIGEDTFKIILFRIGDFLKNILFKNDQMLKISEIEKYSFLELSRKISSGQI